MCSPCRHNSHRQRWILCTVGPLLSQYKCRKKPCVCWQEVELARLFLPSALWAMLTRKPTMLTVVWPGSEQAWPATLQAPESCLGPCIPASRVGHLPGVKSCLSLNTGLRLLSSPSSSGPS